MALDYMPKEAIREIYRVTVPNGRVFLNLHHPSIIPPNLDMLLFPSMYDTNIPGRNRDVLEFWRILRDNGILYKNPDEIIAEFNRYGFRVERVGVGDDGTDKWWKVDLVK